MNRIFTAIVGLCIGSMLLCSSCATILSKSTYPLSVSTHPSGSDIKVSNQKGQVVFEGKTPAEVNLEAGSGFFRRAMYTVQISQEGYEPKEIPIRCTLDRWYLGNLLFNPVGLFIVDPLTGAMWKLDERKIDTVLVRSTAFRHNPSLYFIEYKDIPEALRAQIIRVK